MLDIYPLVTVFIPTYNGGKWLFDTINSVLSQDYQEYILIVSDDCSSDDTVEIAKSFKDRRISVIENQSNLNVKHSAKLLKQCNSKYVKFLMQDDVLERDCLRRQVAFMENHPDVGVTSSSYYLIFNFNKSSLKYNGYRNGKHANCRRLMRELLLRGNRIGSPSQALFRTSVLQGKPMSWSYPYLGELTWYYYVFSQGYCYYHSTRPLSGYRVQADMKTLTLGGSTLTEYKKFIEQAGYLCSIRLNFYTLLLLHFSNYVRFFKKCLSRLVLRILIKSSMAFIYFR